MPRSQIDNDIRASILTIAFAPIQIPEFRIGSVNVLSEGCFGLTDIKISFLLKLCLNDDILRNKILTKLVANNALNVI